MLTVSSTTNWKRRVGLAVLCAAILLIARPGRAAQENVGTPPAAQTNESIESLLRMVEQKIYTNHTTSPAGESAIDAWKRVIQAIPATDSVHVGNALTAFAIRLRRRAAEEERAGNTTVSENLSVFASQADGLKAHVLGSGAAPAGETKETLSEPPKFDPLAGSMPPITPPPPQPAVKPSEAEFYAWRGDLMLAMKDVSAARKYYELAASAGSARAALQLAKMNDPAFVAQSNAEPEARPQTHPHHRRVRARTPVPAPNSGAAVTN